MRRGRLWAFRSYEEEPSMKWFASIAVVALALSAAVAEEKPEAPKPDKDGFYQLFDGKTLDGWRRPRCRRRSRWRMD
jgi:hypothetical protein